MLGCGFDELAGAECCCQQGIHLIFAEELESAGAGHFDQGGSVVLEPGETRLDPHVGQGAHYGLGYPGAVCCFEHSLGGSFSAVGHRLSDDLRVGQSVRQCVGYDPAGLDCLEAAFE